jgi:hypothetical protein
MNRTEMTKWIVRLCVAVLLLVPAAGAQIDGSESPVHLPKETKGEIPGTKTGATLNTTTVTIVLNGAPGSTATVGVSMGPDGPVIPVRVEIPESGTVIVVVVVRVHVEKPRSAPAPRTAAPERVQPTQQPRQSG